MEDKLLQMFFEPERWEYAIAKGVGKDIPKNWLYQMCKPEVRIRMYRAIAAGEYEIAPPHIALIPKEGKGEFREVCVNEPADRVVLSIVNDILFEVLLEKVHPRCMSYLKGVGCGKVVQEASQAIVVASRDADGPIGFKADLSKYFDSVPVAYIDRAFDMIEERCGKSALVDVLRKYYH
jgi:retron-type reverse transcriptase